MLKTTIQNQDVEIYFNVNVEFMYECYIDQYCVKVDLSDKSYDEYNQIIEHLLWNFGDSAICIHGFQEQQVIFVFKDTSEFFIFKYEHLEETIVKVVDHVKEICEEVEVEESYVIEIGITNVEKEEEECEEDEDDES